MIKAPKTVHVPRTSIESKLKSPQLCPSQRWKKNNIGVQDYRYIQRTHKIDSKIPRRISLKTISQTQIGKTVRNYIADLFLSNSNDHPRKSQDFSP
jgi:hypothetical protein